MVLGLKAMGKLITLDNYLSLELKLMGKLITFDNYLSVRQNQDLAWFSDSNLWEN